MGYGKRLVFKGGTAMRFVHLDEYRYSADLDFTVLGGSEEDGVAALAAVLAAAREHASFPQLELVTGNPPSIEYVGPLGAKEPRKIKLDVADDEYVESVAQRTIREVWRDLPEPRAFDVYPLDEIAAEKLRCIIQRVQCRDLYDLYRLTEDLGVSPAGIRPLFERKAEAKRLDPGTFPERFDDRLGKYKSRWDDEMSRHLANPPRFDDVVRVVCRHLRGDGYLSS
jgi:predicted nucleotidyltransferase component of viral defense system